jgi:hypothetical protein
MFFTLNALDMLRVPAEVEKQGLDAYEHGGNAYEQDRKVIRAETHRKKSAESLFSETGGVNALPFRNIDVELALEAGGSPASSVGTPE